MAHRLYLVGKRSGAGYNAANWACFPLSPPSDVDQWRHNVSEWRHRRRPRRRAIPAVDRLVKSRGGTAMNRSKGAMHTHHGRVINSPTGPIRSPKAILPEHSSSAAQFTRAHQKNLSPLHMSLPCHLPIPASTHCIGWLLSWIIQQKTLRRPSTLGWINRLLACGPGRGGGGSSPPLALTPSADCSASLHPSACEITGLKSTRCSLAEMGSFRPAMYRKRRSAVGDQSWPAGWIIRARVGVNGVRRGG